MARRPQHRPRLLLAITALSLLALIFASLVPWYGLAKSSGSDLLITSVYSGAQPWGYMILASALAGLLLIPVLLVIVWPRGARDPVHGVQWLLSVAVLCTIVLGITVPTMMAHPPYGDGPPLTSDGGALVAVVLAAIAALAAWSAWFWGRFGFGDTSLPDVRDSV